MDPFAPVRSHLLSRWSRHTRLPAISLPWKEQVSLVEPKGASQISDEGIGMDVRTQHKLSAATEIYRVGFKQIALGRKSNPVY